MEEVNLIQSHEPHESQLKVTIHRLSPAPVQETREAFEQEAKQSNKPRLLVTAAVAAGISTIQSGYEIPQLSQ